MNNSKVLNLFKALSDETRLKIVKLLLKGEKCVCDIVPFTKRTQSTVSIQLAKLEKLGIVKSRREGKNIYYRIANKEVKKIFSMIDFSRFEQSLKKEISWYPIIDDKKCNGCGLCISLCSRGVFDIDEKRKKAFVKNPNSCITGCTLCGIYCPQNAIKFSDTSKNLKKVIYENLHDLHDFNGVT